jgi:hypothetical protein
MIAADPVEEAKRLLERVASNGLELRLLGGVAVRLRAGGEVPDCFRRDFGDLDFVCARRQGSAVVRFFSEASYEPQTSFNALQGHERLLFYDTEHGRKVDVFVGTFRMCHTIPLADRLGVDRATIPLAELLLTKLQVYELNEKDVRDALLLLHSHEVTDDDRGLNGARVAELCGGDWGLWRTITGNLAVCREHLANYDLEADAGERILARCDAIMRRIDEQPKSRGWRMRAKIGERKRWYELPEEIRD